MELQIRCEFDKKLDTILGNRSHLEGVILGCLFKDILLIKEYNIKEDMFSTTQGVFYFRILDVLVKKAVIKITDTDIRLNCTNDVIEDYKTLGGMKSIEKLKNAVELNNFESYLDELQKRNLYIKLNNEEGIDLLAEKDLFDEKISYLDYFNKNEMTSEEIVKFMSLRMLGKIENITDTNVKEADGEIKDDFLEELFKGSKVGIMFDRIDDKILLPHISKEIMGLKKKTLSAIGAFTNVGKSALISNFILSFASKHQNVLAITNEQEISDFYISFLVYIINNCLDTKGINKRKLKSGKLNDDEKRVVYKAKEYYNEHFAPYITLASMSDTNLDSVERLARKYVLLKNIDVIIYDTFKQNFNGSASESTYKDLIKDSRMMFKLAKNYNLVALVSIQLSQQYEGNLVLSKSMLAGAKQINEILENLLLFRALYPAELDKDSKYYIKPYRRELVGDKWVEKEVELDKNQIYRVMFISKARDCLTFDDSNTASIINFNGFSNSFKEVCLCSPKRLNISQNYTNKK